MATPNSSQCLLNRELDFWLLGGFSIALMAVMLVAHSLRQTFPVFDQRLYHLVVTFSFLSLVCNYPHFLISYKLAYGRGGRFIAEHWFALIAVPAALFALYGLAYSRYSTPFALESVAGLNLSLGSLGITSRIGQSANWGLEVLVWGWLLKDLTVGWHYAKQVFGCMMVYAGYDGYRLSRLERNLLKASLLAVAAWSFVGVSALVGSLIPPGPSFNGTRSERSALSFSTEISHGLQFVACISILIFLAMHWRKLQTTVGPRPSKNFYIPFLAYCLWWMPFFYYSEYSLYAVPFFHCLQYLPFALRMEARDNPARTAGAWVVFAVVLVFVSFMAFEGVPAILEKMGPKELQTTAFFFVAFSMIINIHHFFIDSVIWRMRDDKVRSALL